MDGKSQLHCVIATTSEMLHIHPFSGNKNQIRGMQEKCIFYQPFALPSPSVVHDYIGLYCSGWAKTTPIGVLLTTMAFETADAIVKDFKEGRTTYSTVLINCLVF